MNKDFYSILGYEFKNEELIKTALTHKSVHLNLGLNFHDNERLEFIGDAYLGAVIGFELFKILDDAPEGVLTKKRAYIVCENSLSKIARKLELNKYMFFSQQAIANKVNEKDSVLADCVEAIIGAIYLDSGYEAVKSFILNHFKSQIDEAIVENNYKDYKSELQEYFQSIKKTLNLKYIVDKEEGPDHKKKFYIHVEESKQILGKGTGMTKKEAEQNAAKACLELLKRRDK